MGFLKLYAVGAFQEHSTEVSEATYQSTGPMLVLLQCAYVPIFHCSVELFFEGHPSTPAPCGTNSFQHMNPSLGIKDHNLMKH